MSAPRPLDDVGMHQFGAEVVLRRGDALHLLDPVAAIVWQCLDGEATAAEIVDDLAPVFGREPEALRADVDSAIASFAEAGLLVDAAPTPSPIPFLDPDGTMFCETCVRAPQRAERTVLRIGDHLVVVGTDTPAVRAAVEAALGAHVVADPPAGHEEISPTFSITLAAQAPRGLRPLHVLHRGSPLAVSSRRAVRVLDALPLHLAVHTDLAASGLVALPAVAVAPVGTPPGEPVVLIPQSPRAAVRERRSARWGLTVADGPVVLLDPTTGEVVVGAPGLTVDREPLRALAATVPELGDEPEPLAWGRYPVGAIGARGATDAARALLALAPPNEGWPEAAAALDALAGLCGRVQILEGDSIR